MTQISIADLLKTSRQYFWNLDFTEVEVPYLNSSLPLEPNLYTFKVKDWYLPASPEFALKEYLAKNKQNCFSVAHCFRDLESVGSHHSPEFLMLEYYLVNKNLIDLQKSLEEYLKIFLPDLKFSELKLKNLSFDNEPDFNQYFLNEVEPTLPKDSAVFITGYPSFLSPLAIPNQRFELYINGVEIANGCEENRDAEQIKAAFLKEQSYRQQNHLPLHPISDKFIQDCAALPPCSGLGLGLNRLLMVINQKTSI